MRSVFLVLLGFALLVVETALATLVPIHDLAPNLLLPIAIFLGVAAEVPIVRGAFVCFALGYLLDSFTGNLMGLHTLALVASFLVARGAGARLFPHGPAFQVLLTFVMSLASGLATLAMRGLFERTFTFVLAEYTDTLLRSAIVTALCAPLVFSLARRITGATPARAEERTACARRRPDVDP
jgi:rod shape-determining protein MreD